MSVSAGPHSRYGPENVHRGSEVIGFDAERILQKFNPEKQNPPMRTLHIHLSGDRLAMHDVFGGYELGERESVKVVDTRPHPVGETPEEQALNRHNWRGLKKVLIGEVFRFLQRKRQRRPNASK